MDDQNTNSGDNLQPQAPQNNPGRRAGVFLLIILIVLIAAGILVFLSLGSQNKKAVVPIQTPTSTTTDNLQTEQSRMLGQSKIKLPTITQAQVVASSTLPAEISYLVHS